MKKVLRSASALAAIMVAAPVAAHATDGWYGRIDVGYSFAGGVDVDGVGKADHENDWTEHLGLGYGFKNGFRLEGEVAHRYNDLDTTSTGGVTGDGSTHVWTGMLNGYYDFNKGGRFQPYLGAGIGVGRVKLGLGAFSPAASVTVADTSTRFAYQGLAGVGIALSDRLTLDIGYRYLRVSDLKFDGTGTALRTVVPLSLKADYDQHAATVGLRWQFAAPAAPPPPPPPVEAPPPAQVCPAQDFKVYFEWDRSNLNAAAMDTINAAAARAKECNVSTVNVKGYTDTSGSAKYNIGLSNRRASVVRDALVAAGLPTNLIATEGLGETNLDKPTKDGVREPLNRRTAVTISFQ